MTSPRKKQSPISPPRLTWEYIRKQAEQFRQKYVNPPDLIPVPIEEVIEIDLRLHIIPTANLKEKIDIDGFLTNDLSSICVDCALYMDKRRSNRLRFTLAHEVGHLILHDKEIKRCRFRTPKEWIHFREDFEEEDLAWFESQANEFAGRLLVPKDKLIKEVDRLKGKIANFKKMSPDWPELSEAVSRLLSGIFGVSWEVIQRRILKENIRI